MGKSGLQPTARQCYPSLGMDQVLLRGYYSTVYELPSRDAPLRVSLDGENTVDPGTLPELLTKRFALLTAHDAAGSLDRRLLPRGARAG